MSGYGVRVDLSGLFGAAGAIGEAVFPRVAQAVRAVAEEGAFRWKQKVMHARLWEGEKAPYVESITWRMTGPFEAEITTDYRLAGEIETGRPSRDMKRVLQTSKKTRVVQHGAHKGMRYLVIPLRHNTPGGSGQGAHAPQMPRNVLTVASRLTASRVLPPGSRVPKTRVSGSGHKVPQHSYEWGGRLPAGMATRLNPGHRTDPYAGMVRFQTTGADGKRSSTYMTFRVMGEWSQGWVVQPRAGLYLAKATAEELQPLLEGAIAQAVQL